MVEICRYLDLGFLATEIWLGFQLLWYMLLCAPVTCLTISLWRRPAMRCRRAVHAQLEALPPSSQSSRLRLLEIEGCAMLSAGRGADALAAFRRMVAIEDAVEGACFFNMRTVRTHMRLCSAALLAGESALALATMRAVLRGCCPPQGALSKPDLEGLSERRDFGRRDQREKMLQLIADAASKP